MVRYMNGGGDSGVIGYEIGAGFIRVKFSTGAQYRYSIASAGSHHFQVMCRLAENGQGLNEYINRNVKYGYEAREM